MRIYLDVSPVVNHRAGIGRYTYELMAALLAADVDKREYIAFYNRPSAAHLSPPLDHLPHLTTSLADKPWRLSVLLAYLANVPQNRIFPGVDLFHATDHLLPRLTGVQTVFTLYDLTFVLRPETHNLLNRWFLTLMMPYFLRAADVVIAISECTKRDAVGIYGIDEAKFRVIYGGVSPRFRPVGDREQLAAIRRRYALPTRFLLYVGTIEPRKNLPMLFESFKQAKDNLFGTKLVIAGKKGWLYNETFTRLQALGLEQDVIFTDFVPDDDLPGLYTLAEAFVFPSLYEGFGLPLLEAMACGTPVVCSNTSSLPEVAGDSALLVSPTDVHGWVQAIVQITQNAALRAELRQRGLRQTTHFTWEKTARQTREVYREVYAHRP